MNRLETIRTLLSYSDWANAALLAASASLSDDALDRRFEMGLGTLRRTLIHLYNGEHVWLERWQERLQTPWPSEDERLDMAELGQRFSRLRKARDAYLETLRNESLSVITRYRDSYGDLYRAALGEMLMQACVHSIHHRAQAANMLRQLGAGSIELDYMVHVRQASMPDEH